MNISSGLFFGFGLIASFFSAIPFIITHFVTNLGFSFLLPKTKKIVNEKGKLDEKELCKEYIENIKTMKNQNNEESKQ